MRTSNGTFTSVTDNLLTFPLVHIKMLVSAFCRLRLTCFSILCRGFYIARGNGFYGAGTGQVWLDDVTCHGNETSLLQCKKNPWGQGNCRHREDVGVDCQPSE